MVRTNPGGEDAAVSRRLATWIAALAVACGGTGYVAAQISAAGHHAGGPQPLAVVNG